MCPYGLRQSIRCPSKYGEIVKERTPTLSSNQQLDFVAAKREEWPETPLDNRYIKNAAVLPGLKDEALSSEERTSSSVVTSQPEILLIHGFTVPEYQHIYHSVVDPLLLDPHGEPAVYSLELGRHIKEQLFSELAYPTFQMTEQPSGRVAVLERFCVLRSTPVIDIEI
ncbi:uncharacterized protein C22orf31 [Cynoglossus semilaevis]|uniref:uncharacterized protein C22orf31 n=1 Tax=Cynoglossus semilaevis TaxID=244447 RepID=UPI000498498A|nr:uncharacterized protein C22orf31 homolog [Cynoglossus semilaevis]XP_008307361.1 uncharacterized protein C22orf31 homolog [Cynoglossus semilaevis]